jgi:hypothetical protein
MRNVSQKLLGYALGRTMLVTDLPLIDKLSANGRQSFTQLIEQIVTSRQFRNRRAPEVQN